MSVLLASVLLSVPVQSSVLLSVLGTFDRNCMQSLGMQGVGTDTGTHMDMDTEDDLEALPELVAEQASVCGCCLARRAGCCSWNVWLLMIDAAVTQVTGVRSYK
eukprot:c15386_g1_i1.p1 GENE.c15386_g1_i1~~c15386_g1_i1.p1  ORF type:complete len:104 (+),score=8.30 c15386_g1_i1:115-426(+)